MPRTRTVGHDCCRSIAVLAALGAVLLAPAAAHASLEWSPQPYQRVSQAQTNGDLTRVGADAQGNAVLAWREVDGGTYRVRVAARTPGGYFSRVEFPGGGFASEAGTDAGRPRVAVAPDGSAMVVWSRYASVNMTNRNVIEGVYRSKLGAWSSVEMPTEGPGAALPDVAMDSQGNATVTWIEGYDVKARVRTAGGSYEPTSTIYTQSQAQPDALLFDPLVAVDAAGNAVVSWSDSPTSTISDRFPREVRSAQRSAGGVWEPDKLLTTREAFENIVLPGDVAIHNGTAVVMVLRTSPVAETYTRPAGQPGFTVNKFYEYGSYGTDAGGLTFDANGNALAVFSKRTANSVLTVASAYRPAGGAWGPLVDIPGTSTRQRVSAPAADAAGNFTVLWSSGEPDGPQQLWAATRPPGADSAFDAPQVISEPRPAGEPAGLIEYPDLAVSGQGQAVAVWSHTDGEALRVEAAFGNVPPPVPQPPVVVPPVPPPPPEPPAPSAITLARPFASGKASILTVSVGGDVTRLEWKVDDSPAVFGRVVNGSLQRSVRVRTPGGAFKVTVTASGPGGTKGFTRTFEGARRPTDAAAAQVKIGSQAADVIAVGNADVLTGRTSGCGELTIYAKKQQYSGCFKPIEDLDDIPAAERGVLSPLARAVEVSPSDAVTVRRAVELTDGYVAGGSVLINGRWRVVPRGSARLVSYPQAKILSSSGAGLRIGGRLFTPPGSGFTLALDPASGTGIDLGPLPPPSDLTIGGFGFRGDVKVRLSTLEADIQGNMRLPSFISPAGLGATGEFDVVVPVRFRAGPDDVRGLDGLTVGPMNANVQLTPMTNLKLAYSEASGTWTGGGTACMLGVLICTVTNPCSADVGCLDLQPPFGGLRIRGGRLEYMGVSRAFGAPGKLVAPGAFLERIDVGIKENPARFLGAARIGVGPFVKIDGNAVIAFPSDRAPWYPSRDEVRNLPETLYRTPFTNIAFAASADVILALPIIGETRLGGGYLLYEFPGYVAAGGGADFGVGPVRMLGVISGEYDVGTQTYNLHGDIRACLGSKICAGAIGNISRGPNNAGGAGACLSVGPVSVGGGYQWARATPLVWPLDGCKWSRFKLDVRPRARAAQTSGTSTIEVKAGEPSPAVQYTGAGAAPRIRVSGPSGTLESTDKGLDYTPDGVIRIIRYEEEGTTVTVVGLQDAKPGTYKVETLPGSASITQVMTAADVPAAKVSGKVSGTGPQRTLTYDVGARAGQTVTFRDVTGGNAGKVLRTVSGGRGTIRWSPAPGRAAHTVVASFTLDGIPAEERAVARFTPPPPTLGKPSRLTLKRGKKSKLLVSWTGVRDAARYQVTVLTASGRTVSKLTKSTALTLTGIATSDSGKVGVVALASLRQGKATTKSFKRTTRADTKFAGLKKCKVAKKKVVCR